MKEIYLYGPVLSGRDPYLDDYDLSYICPENVKEALDEAGGQEVTLYVNSLGGSVYGGIAIRNILQRYEGHKTAVVDAIGASAGSMILTGANEVKMYKDTFFMLHYPWTFAVGNAEQLLDVAMRLEKMNGAMVSQYMERFNGEESALRELLADETELTAQEALEYGFCDEIIEGNADKEAGEEMAKKVGDVLAQKADTAESPLNENAEIETDIEDTHAEALAAEDTDTETTEEEEEESKQGNLLANFMPKKKASILDKFKKMEDE